MNYDLMIDEEIHRGIPRLKEEEYEELVRSIRSEGIREPIIVWGKSIVDGRHRYEIAKTYGLEYQTIERSFESIAIAHEWAIRNQLARRNLGDIERFELGEELEVTLKVIAAEKQRSTLKQFVRSADISETEATTEEAPERESKIPAEGHKFAYPVVVVGSPQKAVEKIDVRGAAAKAAGMSGFKYSQLKVIKANNPDALEKIRAGEATANGEYKKLVVAAKKEEEKARIEVRAASLDVNDFGVTVEKGLFTRSSITGASLAIIQLEQGVEVIQQKIAQVVLTVGSLVILVNHTDIERALNVPVASMKYRGDTVLNIDGKIKHALTFSKNPQIVPEYIDGPRDDVMMKLIDAHTVAGDMVIFPVAGLEDVSLIAVDMQRKSVVFDGDMPAELAVRFQGVREKIAEHECAEQAVRSPNFIQVRKTIYDLEKEVNAQKAKEE